MVLLRKRNTHSKLKQFDNFLYELAEDRSCDEIIVKRGGKEVDVGMINIYRDRDIINNFPTLWTDWRNRLDSRIMIFGQDWGPIEAVMETVRMYKGWKSDNKSMEDPLPDGELWKAFVRSEDDRSTNNLIKFLKKSASLENVELPDNFTDDIYVSMAIMFARRGNKFRGNGNFAPQQALRSSIRHMKKQIEIVQPELVVTLGSLALKGMAEIGNFKVSRSLTSFIESLQKGSEGAIEVEIESLKFKLVPIFHPASHVHPDEQLKAYKNIWRNLLNEENTKNCL